MLKNYIKKKSKFSLFLNFVTIILILLLIIPSTRKDVAAFLLKPTRYIHQPNVKSDKPLLESDAYNWKLESLDGDVIKLKHLDNHVLFINMWATWCPPCIAEMPDMQKLYDEYGDKVEFLFISNENEVAIKDFVTRKGYNLPIYMPRTNYPIDFKTNSLPTTYIISKKGEIVVHKAGIANWHSNKVRTILDILIKQ